MENIELWKMGNWKMNIGNIQYYSLTKLPSHLEQVL